MLRWFRRQWDDIKGNVKYGIVLVLLGLLMAAGIAVTHGLLLWQQLALMGCFILLFGWAVFMSAAYALAVREQNSKITPPAQQETLEDSSDFDIDQLAEAQQQLRSLNAFELMAVKQLLHSEGMKGTHFYRFVVNWGFPVLSLEQQNKIEQVFEDIADHTTLLDRNHTTEEWSIKPGFKKLVAYLLSPSLQQTLGKDA